MTQTEKNASWKRHYSNEVERSIRLCNEFNRNQPCKTRPMTKEEYEEAFGEKRESCHKLKLHKE